MTKELEMHEEKDGLTATVRIKEKAIIGALTLILGGGAGLGANAVTEAGTKSKIETNTQAITQVTLEIKTLQNGQKLTKEQLTKLERSMGRVEGILEVILQEVKK